MVVIGIYKLKRIWLFLFVSILFSGCTRQQTRNISEQDVAVAWAELTLYITKNTPANSPTYASRALGYIGLTMYESVVHGYPSYGSMATQLNGLSGLPQPEKDADYSWTLSLNAGQASILRDIYSQTSDQNKHMIDSLEKVFYNFFSSKVNDREIALRSAAYGQAVAEKVFEWSKTDGGHRGYLQNFDKSLVHPNRPGSWKPPLYSQSFSHFPLHPHWGKNRTFVLANSELPLPEPVPYDTTPASEYYREFIKVYEKEKVLTQEEKEIAIWWGDDPSETFTPPGHSYYLATTVLKKEKPELIKCAETYARVGMAVADAFTTCWKWKYHFFSERANTFVPQFVDSAWESFWPDPPFPAFPSGHAIQSAAAATVLTDMFGEVYHFVDSAHVGRPDDELRKVSFKARTFDSFWEVAEETAASRFYGGIHTLTDNRVGLEQGKVIAQNVNNLKWKNEEEK